MNLIMRILLSTLISFLFCLSANGQTSLKQIFESNSELKFQELVKEAESYFRSKYPGKDLRQLAYGEHRDGEYVKYMRWRHFWKSRLESDGQLADLYQRGKGYNQWVQQRSDGRYDDAEWNNISYEQDLGFQIGLGRTNFVAFHPTDADVFYVAAPIGGIWKTENGGRTYTPLGDDLPFMAVSCIVVDQENPETLYISISDRVWYGPPGIGIYKSVDGGQNWTPASLSFNLSQNRRIYWMEADPNNSQKMLVGTSVGVFMTEDGFESHTQILPGRFEDIKFKPGDSNVVYAAKADPRILYKSTDGGATWDTPLIIGGGGVARLAISYQNPEMIGFYVENEAYFSYDEGVEFTDAISLEDADPGDGIMMISPVDQNKIFTGWFDLFSHEIESTNTIQVSDWFGVNGLPLVHVDYRNAFINPLEQDFIYLCNDGGVYKLNCNDNTFSNLSNGLVITQFYDIAVSQSDFTVMSGGSQDNGNVFMDVFVWSPAAPSADGMHQEIDPTNADIRYNGIQNGIIYRYIQGVREVISDNIDGSLEDDDDGIEGEWVTPFEVDPLNTERIVAAYERVYESFDRGDSWQAISEPLAGARNVDYLVLAPSNPKKMYAVENWGQGTGDLYGFNFNSARLFYTDGENVEDWNDNLITTQESVEDIIVHPHDENRLYVSLGGYSDGSKVFESIDGGQSWENISYNLPNAPCTAIAYYDTDEPILFAGTDAGVYYKLLEDEEWSKMGEFPNTYISDLEIVQDLGILRAGTHGRGILETFLAEEVSNTVELDNSSCFDIFPNPAAHELNIQTIEKDVTIEIFDATGVKVYEGTQERINISELSQGLYILQLKSDKGQTLCNQKFMKVE